MPWASPLRRAAGSLAVFTAATISAPSSAHANVVFVLSGADFSGPTANTGGNITVTLANIVNGVSVTIANNLVDPGAFLGSLYLNTSVAPLAGAVGACISCANINNVAPTFSFGSNAFQADGDGLYDILLAFSTAGPDRLLSGESVVLSLTSTTPGFNETSFNSMSAPGGGNGPFVIAAHIQSLPNGQSDWITDFGGGGGSSSVPEPGSVMLVGAGLLGLVALRRHRRKSAA